jgi:clan AA aspartic protease
MITGNVNARFQAKIRVTIHGPSGQQDDVEGVVDTGFNGALTLPPKVIARLGLKWRSRGSAILANGSMEHFDIYAATVSWDGTLGKILVETAEIDPLVGMRLIAGHELRILDVVGGNVTIEALL